MDSSKKDIVKFLFHRQDTPKYLKVLVYYIITYPFSKKIMKCIKELDINVSLLDTNEKLLYKQFNIKNMRSKNDKMYYNKLSNKLKKIINKLFEKTSDT